MATPSVPTGTSPTRRKLLRTLAGTAFTLAYDYDGQLTSVTQGSATTSFAYDAAGRRVGRTVGGYNSESTGGAAVSHGREGFVS